MRQILRPRTRPTPGDVGAGFVTGLFSIPEGMAYASIAGFDPVAGLYAGIVPAIVGSLTARTVLMVNTLTSAIALTSQSVLKEAGLDPTDPGTVATLTVMAGVVMVLMGVLRLGAVMSFVSNAVMTGFATGIALQIITGTLKDATGYRPHGHNRLYQLGDWLAHVGEWQLAATLIALATVTVWALCTRVRRLEPIALLIAMVVVTAAVAALGTDVELVRDIAHIPASPPGVFSGILLALVVLVCAPLAERIPMPVIGGLILVVGGELVWGRRHDILLVLRTSRLSSAAMALTFLATTQLPLQQAIVIGAVFSLLLYCVQAARHARFLALVQDPQGRWSLTDPPDRLPPGEVTVLYYGGVSLFAELPGIEQTLPRTTRARHAVLILVVRGAPDVPSSSMVKAIRRYAGQLREEHGRLILAGVTPSLAHVLRVTGIDRDLGQGGLVPAEETIFAPLERAQSDARTWIAARSDGPTDDDPGH